MKKTNKLVLAIATCGLIATVYNGCGSSYKLGGDDFASVSVELNSGDPCEDELFKVFNSQVHPFVVQNCSACHGLGGQSGIFFGQQDPIAAYYVFETTGVDKWATYATSNHQSGLTGPQNQALADSAVAAWNAVWKAPVCDADRPPDQTAVTVDKVMTATTTANVISFNLDTESNRMGQFAGSTISISVRTAPVAGGGMAYYFTALTLKGPTNVASQPINVNGIWVRVNGTRYALGTTFSLINGTANPNQTVVLSSATMVDGVTPAATDTIGIEFEKIAIGPLL